MKKILDVILIENTNKQDFISSFDVETQADWWNMLDELPNLICMNVEESFISEFRNDSRVVSAEERREAYPAGLPDTYSMTKNITATTPSTSLNGSDYAPLQFYYDTNQIQSPTGALIGSNSWLDGATQITNATYSTRWTGKNVDIVTLETGASTYGPSNDLLNVHNTHPDFKNPDDLNTSRVVAMNWPDLEDVHNNQVTTNKVFSSHGMGVLSAAGGTICGFAKKASLRAVYLTSEDGDVEVINAIISWHNSKAVNLYTGVKNPTIVIGEWQYLQDRKHAIKVDDILSITTPQGVVNRPGTTWGSDFTPFTSRNIIPFQVLNTATSTYEWRIVFPSQTSYTALLDAVDAMATAGIVFVCAGGNNGGVYVKREQAQQTYCTTVASPQVILIQYSSANGTPTASSTTTWYNFIPYGPSGAATAIDVAAGKNSEATPILDGYSNRGPGIDIVGLGSSTWTSYPGQTYEDGNKWGMFSGTSCAAPTVVGKVACLMEEYFTYNNVWPTPEQTKSMLLAAAKKSVKSVTTTTWNDVASASTTISSKESESNSLVRISSGAGANGAYQFTELAGTTNLRAFLNAFEFNTLNTTGKRPLAGGVYPRPNLKTGDVAITDTTSVGPVPTVSITVTSTTFTNGATFPLANRAISAGGSNTSPQLSWSVTGSTGDVGYYRVFAVDDSNFALFWDVTNIPASTTSITENGTWPSGTTINTIDAELQRSNGYYGPRPTAQTGTKTYGFIVTAYHSNGAMLGFGELSGIINTNTPQTYNLAVTAPSTAAYIMTGSHRSGSVASSNNPSIVINVGDTVNFNLSASGGSLSTHPFNIKTAAVTGTGSRVTTGTVTNNGRNTAGTTSWNTGTGSTVTPGTYYYICGNHSSMQGTITVRVATA
jgi:phosphatidylethanolamine-binding protein (PEBP) family uncharacterized protein/plastocyanin